MKGSTFLLQSEQTGVFGNSWEVDAAAGWRRSSRASKPWQAGRQQ